MTVQVDLGTQATGSSLIEEEASALTHCTIQRSFPFAVLVCFLMDLQYVNSLQIAGIRSSLIVMFSLLFLKVLLKRTPYLRPGAVEEHPLIPLGNAEGAAYFIRCPSLNVAQDDDLPLIGRQGFDRSFKAQACFLRQQALFGHFFPLDGYPMSCPVVIRWQQAIRFDSRFSVMGADA
jgi:hypothetical protein